MFPEELQNKTYSNISVSLDYVLWTLNEHAYRDRFVPATIFIGCMILIGATGNGLVLCVYKSGQRASTANFFIFSLSVVDFLICFIVMPFRIFDMRFPLMYGFTWLCKMYELIEISLSMIAVSMMICIAVDRYLIVSKPLKRFDNQKLRRILVICVIVGILCSTPTLIVYGHSSVKTKIPGLVGNTCGVADSMKGSAVTRVWYMYMYIVFVLTLIVLVVLYIRIWQMINTWRNTVIGESMSKDYKYKAIFRHFSHIDKPLIPYGRSKHVTLRSFHNPSIFANDKYELDTFDSDECFDAASLNSSSDSNASLIYCSSNKDIPSDRDKGDSPNNQFSSGKTKLVSCMRKSSSTSPNVTKRNVRLSFADSDQSNRRTSFIDKCSSAILSDNRARVFSSGSVFSNGSKRGPFNWANVHYRQNRRRQSSQDSVFSSCKSARYKSRSQSAASPERKDSFISGSSGSSFGKRARMRRNTIVFGTISLVFVLSYLPCLVVVGMRTLHIYRVMSSPPISSQIAEIFVRSGYMNSILNPFIYSFLCPTFRRGVKQRILPLHVE